MMGSIGLATILLSAMVSPGASSPQPVRLETVVSGQAVTFRVVGSSPSRLRAHYTLKVTGGSGNRSTHSGAVDLLPGVSVTVSSVQLSLPATGGWSATLDVEPDGGERYVIVSEAPSR